MIPTFRKDLNFTAAMRVFYLHAGPSGWGFALTVKLLVSTQPQGMADCRVVATIAVHRTRCTWRAPGERYRSRGGAQIRVAPALFIGRPYVTRPRVRSGAGDIHFYPDRMVAGLGRIR